LSQEREGMMCKPLSEEFTILEDACIALDGAGCSCDDALTAIGTIKEEVERLNRVIVEQEVEIDQWMKSHIANRLKIEKYEAIGTGGQNREKGD